MSSTGTTSKGCCKGICVVVSEMGNNSVIGQLTFTQFDVYDGPVKITGKLSGLYPPGKHGMSVCIAGNLTNGATSCGPIFNPFGKTHGSSTDENRMVGDLGNIISDENGIALVDITDSMIKLMGPHSIIGRSIVVYAGEDDQGRGGHEHSLSTGNAGPRIAAGVIGLSV